MRSTRWVRGGALLAVTVSWSALAAAEPQPPDPGRQLPKPWGIGFTYYGQSQPYSIESLKLGVPGIDPAVADNVAVDNHTHTEHVTFDYWVLPFLNLQAIIGSISTDTDVALSTVNIGIPLQDLEVKSTGVVYGGGVTLAYGYKRVFTTLTGQYMATSMDEEGASVKSVVVTPKLGVRVASRGALFAGAMYQRPEEEHKGRYDVPPLGTVDYSVKLTSAHKWGFIAGASVGLTEHWVITAEAGFGERDSVLAHLDYRF